MTGIIDLFDFDRCTGELSNWDSLGIQAVSYPGPGIYYGCSFSPDGTKVYVSEYFDSPWVSHLWQWDLTAPDIRASKTLIYTSPDSVILTQHQLGPDGKIYISQRQEFDYANPANYHLSVINDPNQPGAACNFTYASLWLKGRRTTYSLPNLANYNLPPMVAQVAEAGPQPPMMCPGDSVRIGYPDSTGGVVTYRWWPTAGIADTAAAYSWASPDTTTWYYLTATDTQMGAPCGVTVDSVLVRVVASGEVVVASLGADTTICAGDSIGLGVGAVQGWQYAWSTGDTASQIMVAGAGMYSLTVTNPAGSLHCLTDADTVVVAEFPALAQLPADPAGRDTVVCRGDTVLMGSPPVYGWTYDWSPMSFINDPSSATPLTWPPSTQEFLLTVSDSATGGQCAMVMDSVVVTVEQPFAHEAPVDVTFCPGECFEIGVDAMAGMAYRWSPTTGLSNPTASRTRAQPTATTTYTLTVNNPGTQSANCWERQFTVTATADACNRQSFIAVNGNGVAESLDLGDHAGRVELRVWDVAGRYVFRDMDYRNDWSEAGASGTSASRLSRGVYIYKVNVIGDCPAEWVGKIIVFN